MTSLRQWWRRAAAAAKERRSLLLARARLRRTWHHRELEAAVIRATSHEERWLDYRSAARVFAWAHTSPALVRLIMWALARRARRTRCWAVALKVLMIAHGLLLRSGLATRAGRVPFELANFRDRSSSPARSPAFSAFVRAYFRFLDNRFLFAAQEDVDDGVDDGHAARLDRIAKMQFLLDLLLQIRPYGDGMEVPLVLEAMDCVVIEIFDVHGEICTDIARLLVGMAGAASPRPGKAAAAIEVLRRAAEQSAQLSSYFELCRGLGVVNARRLPAFKPVSEDDVRDLERLLMADAGEEATDWATFDDDKAGAASDAAKVASSTVLTTEWVTFDEDKPRACACAHTEQQLITHWNPFAATPWDVREGMNLIELS